MERRVLLAIFLAFLVLYVWQAAVVKPVPKPAQTPASPAASPAIPPVTPGGTQTPAAPANAEKPPVATAPAAAPLVADTSERDVRVETRDVIAVFTNRGARLKSWRLKRYLDQGRQPQELLETTLPEHPLPFTLRAMTDVLSKTLNESLYTVSGAPTPGESSTPIDVRFEYRDSGVHAIKEFHFDPASYIVTFHAAVRESDRAVSPAIVWGPAVGDTGEQSRYITP